jgi:hypothetical protein
MKSLRAKTSVLIVASGIILTAIGLFWLSAGRGTRDARVYRIGWESDPPFQVALADGEPSGLAIELVREAARRRNIRLEWIRRQRAGEASLVNQQVDLWPLMTITQRRKKRFYISDASCTGSFFWFARTLPIAASRISSNEPSAISTSQSLPISRENTFRRRG